MAKFVQPNIIFDSSVSFLRNVQFDSSVYLQGVTHISNPTATSGTPYALVVDSLGNDIQVKSLQLGSMATATESDYYTTTETDSAISTAIDAVDSSLVDYTDGAIATAITAVDGSLVTYVDDYNGIQDSSILFNTEKWIDSNRNGLLNQTETTLAFVDTTGVFTLGDAGLGWSYYLNGQKYTFSGPTSIALPGGGSATADRYYIYIDNNTDASLAVSTAVWDREAGQLPVAFIDFDSANAFSTYWMGEERHTMLIDTRMHKYLHNTRGTQFISGGTLTGPDVSAGGPVTDFNNVFGVATTVIADEDIYQNLAVLSRPADPTGANAGTYNVFRRSGASDWTWQSEDTPLPEAGGNIQYDNGTGLSTATDGKFVNTYLMFTNLNGKARYSIIPGQGEYDTVESAIDENFAAFNLDGLPIAEYVAAWQFTWEVSTGYSTAGNVALASAPVRIQVNSATASTPTTEAHNDLLGLQGGSATQRYHLDLAQYNDYIGKSDVDSSLLTVWNELGYLDSSIGDLDLLTQRHTTDISDVSTRVNVVEPIVTQHTTDISDVSTRVNVVEPIVTQHTTDISDVSTRVNVVEPIVTQHTTDISDVSTRVQTNEGDITRIDTDVSDVSTRVQTLEGNVGDYVLKTGDSMSGALSITNGGLSVSNDVSISGGLLVSGTDGLIVTNDAFIGGSLTIDGSLFVTNVETIDVSAAFIHLNTGLTGTPPATMQSGMVIGRGSENPYVFIFDETLDTFRIGAAVETSTGYLDVDTQAVATREDVPVAYGVGYWNGTDFQIETSVGFTFTPGTGLGLPIATDSSTEATALMWDGATVLSRELGTMAFASTANFATATDLSDVSTRVQTNEGAITILGTDISDVSTRVQTNEGAITILGTDISDVSTRVQTNEGDITILGTDISDVSTRVQTNEGAITILGTDISDVSTRVQTNEGAITILGTDISDVSTRVQTNEGDITILGTDISDVSTRVQTNEALLIVHDASLGAIDTSLGNLDTAIGLKVNRSGDTMGGLLTFATAGVTLDGVNIKTIDTSVEGLSDSSTSLATSAAISKAIAEAVVAGVTASNGLTEDGGDIQLGGTLSKDTTIDLSTHAFDFSTPGDTTQLYVTEGQIKSQIDGGNSYIDLTSAGGFDLYGGNGSFISRVQSAAATGLVLSSDGSIVITDNSGSELGAQYAADYQNLTALSLVHVAYLNTEIGNLDTSLVGYTNTAVGNVDTSLVTYTNTAIGNLDSSLVNYVDGKAVTIGASNGLNVLSDGSVGLGGALTEDTSIDTTGYTLSFRGLQTSLIDTPLALVQDSADSSLLVRELGTMAWATATDFATATDLSDVSTRVQTNEGAITILGTDISDVSTRVQTNEGAITILGTDISDVSTRVQTNEGAITIIGTDISDVSTRVQTNEGAITILGTDISDVSTRVQTLEGNVGDYVLKTGDTMSGPLTISAGGLSVTNDVSISGGLLVSGSGGLIVTNDAFIGGSLTIDGSLFVTNVETIDVSAAFIHLNTGLTGTPPATMQSGMVVGRGSEDPYVFLFDETLDTFRIGVAIETSTGYLDVDTQAVATREDAPVSWGVGYWNGTDFQIETSTGFTFEPGVGLSLPIVTDQGSEATVLSIQSGLVGSVELGTMAFASTANFATATDLSDVSTRVQTNEGAITILGTDISDVSTRVQTNEGAITILGTDISDVSTRVNVVEPIVTRHTTDISDVSTRVQTNEGDITILGTDISDVSTRVQTNEGAISTNTQSITDLSTGKLDNLANTGEGTYQIYGGKTDNVAYIKELIPGTGATITQDSSTITIGVTGAAGYVSKYTTPFVATGIDTFTVTDTSHNLGTGPFNVSVYEGGELVYTGVENSAGDVVLTWSPTALSGTCEVFITG